MARGADMSFWVSIFKALKVKPQINGYIGFFNLSDWWLSEFSLEERTYIEDRFKPLGSSGKPLTQKKIGSTSETVFNFLNSLSGWFNKKTDISISHRIIEKAESLITQNTRVMDKHFLFGAKIKSFYKDRDNPVSLAKAIEACEQQIDLSPQALLAFKKKKYIPSHRGYEQLCIIRENQKDYESAAFLAKKALRQGWAGDWEGRIDRCKKKADKSQKDDQPVSGV
jgi:hypothetical protein